MIKIPLVAISLLEKHPNQMRWDENNSVWTFLDTFTGTRKNFLMITCITLLESSKI